MYQKMASTWHSRGGSWQEECTGIEIEPNPVKKLFQLYRICKVKITFDNKATVQTDTVKIRPIPYHRPNHYLVVKHYPYLLKGSYIAYMAAISRIRWQCKCESICTGTWCTDCSYVRPDASCNAWQCIRCGNTISVFSR